MTCQCPAGLLVLRECGEPAFGACGFCGRALCVMHQTPGPDGIACPECASTRQDYEETSESEAAATRKEYYDEYGSQQPQDPAMFSAADREALRRRQAQSHQET